MTVINS